MVITAHDVVGPRPFVRALVGVLLGVALGAVAAALVPRTRTVRSGW